MREQRRGSGVGRTLAAFGIGAAAGSVLALLYAPASGQVTRKRIATRFRTLRRKAEQLKDTATERIGDARTWVMQRIHSTNGNDRRVRHHAAVHHN